MYEFGGRKIEGRRDHDLPVEAEVRQEEDQQVRFRREIVKSTNCIGN